MSEVLFSESFNKELTNKVFKNVLAEHIKREIDKYADVKLVDKLDK